MIDGKVVSIFVNRKKPCLNEGQCIIHKNLTLECVCRQDWTGDRCEIPRSQCVHKPCGAENQCQMLIASDYSQDYVCICDDQQRYGRNCQQSSLIIEIEEIDVKLFFFFRFFSGAKSVSNE